jgi:hypothetical protein
MKYYFKNKPLRENWEKWFAWHPVQCEKTVERKEIYGYGGASWRFREIFKVAK